MTHRGTFVSLFAGVGGFDLAMERAGYACAGQCEIDPHARAVLERHWPNTPRHDDVQTLTASTFAHPDVVTFGSPCQDLSVAGARAGMVDGTRSGLFMDAVRYIREVQEASGGRYPRFAVWENVPGAYSSNGGRDFATVLALLVGGEVRVPTGGWSNAGVAFGPLGSAEWRTLDSRYFGVAQRRRRVFLVYRPGGERAGEVLLEPDGVQRDTQESETERQGTAVFSPGGFGGYREGVGTLRANGGDVGPGSENLVADTLRTGTGTPRAPIVPVAQSLTTGTGCRYDPETETLLPVAFAARDYSTGRYEQADVAEAITTSADRTRAAPIVFAQNQRDEVRDLDNLAGAIAAEPGMKQQTFIAFDLAQITSKHNRTRAEPGLPNGTLPAGGDPHVATSYAVRRLTPRECERLQAFPDDWTRYRPDGTEIADTHRYRLMGNAVTTSVVEWIGRRLPA